MSKYAEASRLPGEQPPLPGAEPSPEDVARERANEYIAMSLNVEAARRNYDTLSARLNRFRFLAEKAMRTAGLSKVRVGAYTLALVDGTLVVVEGDK